MSLLLSSPPNRLIPSPAIVAQDAVRRFPRWALLLLCTLYVAAGFLGREPWKSADMSGFSLLFDLIGTSEYAWVFARLAAASLLAVTLTTTWYGTYYLARRESAQPVPFAFGGEARPTDYARAVADGALLALIACLGLAQLSHETTPALLQLALVSVIFLGLSGYRFHPVLSAISLLIATPLLIGVIGSTPMDWALAAQSTTWKRAIHMLVWFAWPAWALAVLALIKWRRHWLRKNPSAHILTPLMIVSGHLLLLPVAAQQDRWFLSSLPALASLAAFALPTLRRNLKSLIDLFTLLFFSGCAIIIWVVWLAMQTGIPPQPAANVARLAPEFTPTMSLIALLLSALATIIWTWLVSWRIGKHRPAIWMSMVLPAGGAVLCWTLLMSLWLPLLDHARSYKPLMTKIQAVIPSQDNKCLQVHGLTLPQVAAVRYYLDRPVDEAHRGELCGWLLTDSDSLASLPEFVQTRDWQQVARLRRPTDDDEEWVIFKQIKAQ